MKLVVQRVKEAKCVVDNVITGQIDQGFMVLVGIANDDNKDVVYKMANKLSKLRIFEDDKGKMNLDLAEVKGKILSISQFTLYGDLKKGNRPSFTNALNGKEAKELYDYFNECLMNLNIEVQTGIFGADMKIHLINDGPVTIILDSKEINSCL